MAFVVDNSVTIAWCVSAQANAYSRRVLERSRREAVHAPQVWPFEFLNTLRTLERRAKLFEHQVAGIVTRVARMRIEVDREMAEHRALLELSRRWDLSVYDAATPNSRSAAVYPSLHATDSLRALHAPPGSRSPDPL